MRQSRTSAAHEGRERGDGSVARPARRPPKLCFRREAELNAVHGYLVFLTGNRNVAEDLTGETFEKAWRS
jgi:hypothetical protein